MEIAMSRFQEATRKQLKLRMAICGPTGAGKTMTALKIASALGQRIAVIDTENKSASVYVGRPGIPKFQVLELEKLAPRDYVEAITDAENEAFDVVIVDSLSHAWQSKDGALAMADRAAKRSQSGNSYTAWRDVTPEHDALVDKLLRCKAHLITTMRSKMEYVLEENDRGKKTPRKVGMAPIQRSGMEYEFHVTVDMDVDHNMMVSKTRCDTIDGLVLNRPGREFGEKLLAWLDEGEAAPERPLASAGQDRQQPTSAPANERRQAGNTADAEATRGETPKNAGGPERLGELDEYGLTIPRGPCPVVRAGKQNAGKRWDELPGPLVAKMYDEFGDRMSKGEVEWAEYILAKRQARKAREAEQAAAEAALAVDEQRAAHAVGTDQLQALAEEAAS
jgi:hypothetical protein